jgi:hypothetical protein
MNDSPKKHKDTFVALGDGKNGLPAPFEGEMMVCAICGRKKRSDPAVESNWRAIDLDEQRYYICVQHFPPDGSGAKAFKHAYDWILRKLIKKYRDS